MRERLDRLMKKQEDGSWKCVGYMKMEDGIIYHKEYRQNYGQFQWGDILELNSVDSQTDWNHNYVPHDRADQYTGHKLIDDTKVFERDQFETLTGHIGTTRMLNGRWVIDWESKGQHNCKPLYTCNYDMIITGIDGVKETG